MGKSFEGALREAFKAGRAVGRWEMDCAPDADERPEPPEFEVWWAEWSGRAALAAETAA